MIKGCCTKMQQPFLVMRTNSLSKTKGCYSIKLQQPFLYMCFIFVFSYTEILAVRLSQADFQQLRQGSSEKFQWWFQCR